MVITTLGDGACKRSLAVIRRVAHEMFAEGFLFNDALGTFYLRLHGVRHMVKDHFVREETCCRHYMDYSFRLAARFFLYAP